MSEVRGAEWSRAMRTPSFGGSLLAALAALLVFALLLPEPLAGQYFGRNKVMYDDFDFEVLETDHFDVHYYDPARAGAIRDFGRMAERWYDRLGRALEHEFEDRKPIIVYRNQPDFQQTNAIPGFVSQATGGVTESVKDRVILPFARSYAETDHVLGHELVHAFQYDLARAGSGGGSTAIGQVPLWFVEGMAEYLSVGRRSPHTAMWMRDAVRREALPTIRDMANPQAYFPYRFGQALWAYLAGASGDEMVGPLYRATADAGFPAAVEQLFGVPVDSLSAEWQRATRAHYEPFLEGRSAPTASGRVVLDAEARGGSLHLAPRLSPGGDRMVVLSQQDPFSIDLFVVAVPSGRVEGRLASANTNPHFDALAYTNTTGAWSPDERSFAFVTYAEGENEIALADVEDRSIRRTIELPDEIGAVFGLAWHPEGDRIAFTGSRSGVSDLFLLELESGSVEALTDDRHAEWQASWSPDGTRLAFATDRGRETDFEELTYDAPGIGVVELASGDIEVTRVFDAKHVDPTWDPVGESLYFISDPDGFADVYRLETATETVYRVTRLATGVSGLTALSPALTVASGSGRIAFTVFDDGGYHVVTRPSTDAVGDVVEPSTLRDEGAGVLPPSATNPTALVSDYLESPTRDLPDEPGWSSHDYVSDLQFDYLAQPTAGISVDRFGTTLGGSVAAFFSDMLGNRSLGVGLSVNGRIEDIGGQAIYMDRGQRLAWGLQGGRIPYRQAFTRVGNTEVDGTPARTVDLVIDRTAISRVSALAEYPLSRTRRIEARIGGTRIGFDRDIERSVVLDGQVVDRRALGGESPDALHLATASVAWVQDNSIFGFTSPVEGGRTRIEVEGNLGSLDYVNLLADARRYLFLDPATVAFRGLHYGRYGGDAEGGPLSPIFLGQGTFVRGYSIDSFRGSECTDVPERPSACPEFDRLVGSRIAVANLELRLPLLGTEQFGLLDVSFLPTELALFTDAGVAWTSDESPSFDITERSTERIPVISSGAGLRFNLAGRLVAEVYWAYPFQRPERGGQWGFQISPGW